MKHFSILVLLLFSFSLMKAQTESEKFELLGQMKALYGLGKEKAEQKRGWEPTLENYEHSLLAKAKPDECYFGEGNPNNKYYGPESFPGACAGGQAKTNEAYVWGLTRYLQNIWFGTGPNVNCIIQSEYMGPIANNAMATESFVCEFIENTEFGSDWRPPSIYVYNTLTDKFENKTKDAPVTLINDTRGIRSAGSHNNVALLAGQSIAGGINIFAYNATSGEFIDATTLMNLPGTNGNFTNIRKWLVHNDILYTTLGTASNGYVLRWKGDVNDPFQFDIVGILDTEGAELVVHKNRLYVSTWPLLATQAISGLWMSCEIPDGGLTAANVNDWKKVWEMSLYEPDPLLAFTYGGGALASYDGYLYWGTMHVPFLTFFAHATQRMPGTSPEAVDYLLGFLGSHRATTVFRAQDFDAVSDGDNMQTIAGKITNGAIDLDLVYGMPALPAYNMNNEEWEIKPNNLGKTPINGISGVGNIFNNYLWTMANYDDKLYMGTMDWSYLLWKLVEPMLDNLGYDDTYPFLETLEIEIVESFCGADLFEFESIKKRSPDDEIERSPVSLNGLGNHLSYGVRTMESGDGLVLGMANPMNLEAEGGWSVHRLRSQPRAPEAEFISYEVNVPDTEVELDPENKKIKISAPSGTNINDLLANFELTPGATAYVDGVEQNPNESSIGNTSFQYILKAQDGTISAYDVLVNIIPAVPLANWGIIIFVCLILGFTLMKLKR